MLIFGLKNCDTCRKALKSLPDATFIDVRDQALPQEILDAAIKKFDHDLVNKRSTTWRNLSDEERATDAQALIPAHPSVMKRPLIVDGARMYLGWTPEVRAALGVA